MKKISVVNNITGKTYQAIFDTQEELNEWKSRQIQKDSWGKKERWVRSVEDSSGLDTRVVQDELGNDVTEYRLEVEYSITEQDYEESYKVKRQREYPELKECIHALLDGGSTLSDLQAARQAVKDKYPKP